jgi:hypothetical protein
LDHPKDRRYFDAAPLIFHRAQPTPSDEDLSPFADFFKEFGAYYTRTDEMSSKALIECLKSVVTNDLKSNASVIRYFITHNVNGGWEAWLQAVYALQVMNLFSPVGFNREVVYPDGKKSDLWFRPQRGADMWIELKTQRFADYSGTVGDFSTDIYKILQLDPRWLKTNVVVAMAILSFKTADQKPLNELRNGVRRGQMGFFKYANDRWELVYENDAQPGDCLLLVWTETLS